MTPKEYWGMTKWEWFLEGFDNIKYALDCYNNGHKYGNGYYDFWEAISWGWMAEYIFPYDDPYNPFLSPERKLRLGKW
jgi:hypothetical protein